MRAGSQEAAASAVTQSIRPLHAGLLCYAAIPDSCEGHCAAARTTIGCEQGAGRRARMRAGVRRDSTRVWLAGGLATCTSLSGGLSTCEPRGWVQRQTHAIAAARGGHGRCCSGRRARSEGTEGTVQKDRLWVSIEVGFVNFGFTGLRFRVIGQARLTQLPSTTTQPCSRFMLMAVIIVIISVSIHWATI